jgi:hypothetical protein
MATHMTKSWKDKVAHHEGLIRLIEPGNIYIYIYIYICIIIYFNLFSVAFMQFNLCEQTTVTFLGAQSSCFYT